MRFHPASVLVPIYDRHSEHRFPTWLALACVCAAGLAGLSILGAGAGEHPVAAAGRRALLPAERGWAWLAAQQNADGSFGTGNAASREVVTGYIVGLTAASDPRDAATISMLDRAVSWLVDRPVPPSTGSPESSRVALRVLALAAERDRRDGRLVPGHSYVESLDPELFAAGPETGTGAFLARALAPWSMAQAALDADRESILVCLRDNFYRAQLNHGGWGSAPGADVPLLETAATLRALWHLELRLASDAEDRRRPQ